VREKFWDNWSHGWMSMCDLVEPKLDLAGYHKWNKVQNEPTFSCFATTMAQGQAVSESIQWTIIRLSAMMPSHEISGYTDISDRKIRGILAHFKKTGDINVSKRERATLHGSLQDDDIQVLFIFVLLGYTHLYGNI
jgi:hypothetical protein